MSTTTKEIAEHARFIRNAAPQAYTDFCKAFEVYTESMVLAVVHTTGEDLLRAQGRAQGCLKVLRMLEDVKNG